MGRAGSGGGNGGGFHSSGGGHSTGFSGGGHRVGESSSGTRSRAGAGNSSFSGSNIGSSMKNYVSNRASSEINRVIRNTARSSTRGFGSGGSSNRGYGGGYGGGFGGGYGGGFEVCYGGGFGGDYSDGFGGFWGHPNHQPPRRSSPWPGVIIIALLVVVFLVTKFGGSLTGGRSTIARERIDGTEFVANCVVDEIDYINNEGKTGRGLKEFWKETGVQPWVYFKAYEPSLNSDETCAAWAKSYAESLGYNHIFLFVYFESEAESLGNDSTPGYMYHITGPSATQVMDNEAVGLFWNYLDADWVSWDSNDTDGMMIHIFDRTAKTIMRVSTTTKDIVLWVVIGLVVIAVGSFTVIVITKKRNAERERAEETERILSASNDMLQGTESSVERLGQMYDDN